MQTGIRVLNRDSAISGKKKEMVGGSTSKGEAAEILLDSAGVREESKPVLNKWGSNYHNFKHTAEFIHP